MGSIPRGEWVRRSSDPTTRTWFFLTHGWAFCSSNLPQGCILLSLIILIYFFFILAYLTYIHILIKYVICETSRFIIHYIFLSYNLLFVRLKYICRNLNFITQWKIISVVYIIKFLSNKSQEQTIIHLFI